MPPGPPQELDRPASGTVIDVAVLAERRAQRTDAVSALEARVAELEEELAAAEAERDDLEDEVRRTRVELTATRQREFAEQQVRVELQEELAATRQVNEHEIASLRARLATAQDASRRLEVELTMAQRKAAASARETAALQEALEGRLHELTDRLASVREQIDLQQADLERRLEAEVAARRAAEARADAHEAAADEVAARERGEVARAIAQERERAAREIEAARARADAEAAARRRALTALAELQARVPTAPAEAAAPAAETPAALASAIQAEVDRIRTLGVVPPARVRSEQADAEDLIAGLARAAERLRAQAEAAHGDDGPRVDAAPTVDAAPAAEDARPRRRWWPWRRRRRAGQD
jgi:chromosome segregation ATPase